jgi:hypothetical protein
LFIVFKGDEVSAAHCDPEMLTAEAEIAERSHAGFGGASIWKNRSDVIMFLMLISIVPNGSLTRGDCLWIVEWFPAHCSSPRRCETLLGYSP